MVVVHQTAEVEHIGIVALGVQTVQHGDEAAPKGGKHNVRVPTHLYKVASQPGQVCLCEKKTKKYKLQRKSQSANFGTSSVLFLCSFIGIAEHIAELPVDFNMLICKHIDCFYKGVS